MPPDKRKPGRGGPGLLDNDIAQQLIALKKVSRPPSKCKSRARACSPLPFFGIADRRGTLGGQDDMHAKAIRQQLRALGDQVAMLVPDQEAAT